MQYFHEQKKRGGSLIVADPRATPTTAAATLHLQITPGTDAALANGLLHIAIKDALIDEAFIAERTTDFETAAMTPIFTPWANARSIADTCTGW